MIKYILIAKQLLKFGIVGIINTSISLVIYYFFIQINKNFYIAGNIVGFFVSTLNSYFLNSTFVFANKKRKMSINKCELVKSYIAYGSSLAASTLLLYFEVDIWCISEKTAPLINLLITIPLNFSINKFWVYKGKDSTQENEVSNIMNNFDGPLVSICIPTYNGALYIRESLESVIKQSYNNLEIIISDDGSTDDTLNIVKNFTDKRIRIITNNDNHGMLGNSLNCIKNAQGKYIKLLFQDDLIYKDCILKEVLVFENNPSVSVVTGASNVINSKGDVLITRKRYKNGKLISGKKFAKRTFLIARNSYGEPAITMFKTGQVCKENIYGENDLLFVMDWDACLSLSYIGDVYYIPDIIGAFRVDKSSTSVKMDALDRRKIYEMYMKLFKKHSKLGIIKLDRSVFIRFKIFTVLNILARSIVYKLKLK